MSLEAIDYATLDPGIRDIVQRLREVDFETTDSGDGVSKPLDPCALFFPHVFCVTTKEHLIAEAERLQGWLDAYSRGWRVEASYAPQENSALLLAMKLPTLEVRT